MIRLASMHSEPTVRNPMTAGAYAWRDQRTDGRRRWPKTQPSSGRDDRRGLATGLAESTSRAMSAAVARDIRNAEDAALVAPLLATEDPSLGTWAVEPDFARLVASDLIRW
jgi:hypothetical protein